MMGWRRFQVAGLFAATVVLLAGCGPPDPIGAGIDAARGREPGDILLDQVSGGLLGDEVDPLSIPQPVGRASPADERAYLQTTRERYGDLSAYGFTDESWLSESYRWCAMIAAVGRDQAYEELRAQVAALYPPEQRDLQYDFTASGNRLIEQYLCQ